MTTITTRVDMDCELIQSIGSDEMIARAAWVSTGKDQRDTTEKSIRGVLKFLMENRHGTPFEHNLITLRIDAPIFIWREWHRHRIGFSYNEESGRYTKLRPVFYVPGEERAKHCIKPKDFKPSKPGFRGFLERESNWLHHDNGVLSRLYEDCYEEYERRIDEIGYDNGLARICLPVSIYSACYVTCNARSMMAFLELRTDNETALRRSAPLWELHNLAHSQVEPIFASLFPITYDLWVNNKFPRMGP